MALDITAITVDALEATLHLCQRRLNRAIAQGVTQDITDYKAALAAIEAEIDDRLSDVVPA